MNNKYWNPGFSLLQWWIQISKENRLECPCGDGFKLETSVWTYVWLIADPDSYMKNIHRYVYKHKLIHTYKFPCSVSKGFKSKNTPTKMSTTSRQILVSKYHAPVKDARVTWRNGWFQDWGRKCIRWTWSIL